MKSVDLHEWEVPPKEAVSIQKRLKDRIRLTPLRTPVRKIAGADISVYRNSGEAYAGVVVFSYPDLTLLEQRGKKVDVTFPYIPGLLSFREIPVLLKVFEGLKHDPDLILVDGQGIAHPRGFGIASHLGLLFQKPTVGCAKSWLYGAFQPPPPEAGSLSYLYSKGGQVIGAVLRTRRNVRPLFVSCGHKIDLSGAVHYTLSACRGFRQPEPTRQAHRFVKGLRVSH